MVICTVPSSDCRRRFLTLWILVGGGRISYGRGADPSAPPSWRRPCEKSLLSCHCISYSESRRFCERTTQHPGSSAERIKTAVEQTDTCSRPTHAAVSAAGGRLQLATDQCHSDDRNNRRHIEMTGLGENQVSVSCIHCSLSNCTTPVYTARMKRRFLR